jgi:SWI/SNF-related matrix-associated actin-dependent regulator of chromatin subfamily A-like protein 1
MSNGSICCAGRRCEGPDQVKLSFVETTRTFVLRVPRSAGIDARVFKEEHGLDWSTAASSPSEAVYLTREPYAAVPFWPYASEGAQVQLLDLQQQIDASWAKASGRHVPVPPDQELAPFQIAGVDYAMGRRNTLIGDQPGLGKTMQAIALANDMQAERVLVICPANIRLQWMERIHTWSTMRYPYTIAPILHGRHGVHPTAAWTVVSYELSRKEPIWRALAEGRYDLIVIDEIHYLKTIDALRTRAIFGGGHAPIAEPLASRADRIVGLSGTPLPNRPRESYTYARALDWASIDWMSEDKFTHRFNPSITRETDDGRIYVDERSGRHSELQARLRANFMVRRLKSDVLPQLKLPVLDIVHVEETGPVKQALHAESLLDIDPEDMTGIDAKILGDVSTVRRLMGVAIAPQAADYVQMLLEGGEEKVVLFAWHTQVLDILEAKLHRYSPLRIDGSTSPTQRQKRIKEFALPGHRVMMGNMLAMGIGTDGLQEVCQRGVAAEADWVPGTNIQCVDRLHRMGQTGVVQFDFMVAKGSFAERVLGTSLRKAKTVHKALDHRYEVDAWSVDV